MTTDQARAGLRAAIRLQRDDPSAERARAIDEWRLTVDDCNRREQAQWACRPPCPPEQRRRG
jgi:hypothetical protein